MERDVEIIKASTTTFKENGDEFSKVVQLFWMSAFISGAKWSDEHPVDVWHDVSEEPKDYLTQILYQDKYGICWTASKQEKFEYDWDWERFATAHLMVRWAYINDLLPKRSEE